MIFDSIFWTAYIPFAVVTLWLIAGDWLRRLRKFPAQPRPSQLSWQRTQAPKHLVLLTIITSGMFAAAMALGTAAPALAKSASYPWCIQGSTYRCWFMTREQCEEAVDNRGFCVTDPNVPRS